MKTRGRSLPWVWARADARFRVPWTRLSRMAFFLASVQRPTTLSPARWITASKPETASGGRGARGFHDIWSAFFDGPRTRRTMRDARDSSDGSRAAPIGPETPVTRKRSTLLSPLLLYQADRTQWI